MIDLPAVVAFVIGTLLGAVLVAWRQRRAEQRGPDVVPADAQHAMELLRRAHTAWATCLVTAQGDPIIASAEARPHAAVMDRIIAAAWLARGDGRDHVLKEGVGIVASGNGTFGAAVLWSWEEVKPVQADAAIADLKRLVAEFKVARMREQAALADRGGQGGWKAHGPESVEGVTFALCEAARAVSDRPTAAVFRDPSSQRATVVAVSQGTDRRLIGLGASAESVVGRACLADVPIVARTHEEFFGRSSRDRRKSEGQGIAFPLHDGREGHGALVVFGPPEAHHETTMERLHWLVGDTAPRLGSAAALRAAEVRSMTDELTGLPNRRALERAMTGMRVGPASLLMVDIDRFKQLNDGFGHAAGDAALKHLAWIFRGALRDGNVAARIGGEEFALWLADTPLGTAVEIAERIREATANAKLSWAGAEFSMTCSIGVANVPDTVREVANLRSAADAALYRAKGAGRNRVEVASSGG